MDIKNLIRLSAKNFLFWLSREIGYPLVPPDSLQVNFSFRCNLHCAMCSMQSHKKTLEERGERTEIDSVTFRKIMDEARGLGVRHIILLGGEPFLREDLFPLVDYAKQLKFNVALITNGVLLDKKTIDRCIDAQINSLNISLDAASQETFLKIRGENVLSTVIENIRIVNAVKAARHSGLPRLSAICTIMNDNLEELTSIARLCKELKMDTIAFQPVVMNNVDQSSIEYSSQTFVCRSRLGVLNEAIDGLIDYKEKMPGFIANSRKHLALIKRYFSKELKARDCWPCYAGYNRIQVTQDYPVYFCIPPGSQYKSSFGDVSKDTLKDLWYSKDAMIRRKLMKKCHDPCLQWCSYRYEFIQLSEFYDTISKRAKRMPSTQENDLKGVKYEYSR